jgi:opacity protein-like surface antigen
VTSFVFGKFIPVSAVAIKAGSSLLPLLALNAIGGLVAGSPLLFLGAAPAQAEGWYAGFGAGWSVPDDSAFRTRLPAGAASGELSLNGGVSMDVAVGYRLTLPVRLETEFRFASFDGEKLNFGSRGNSTALSGRTDVNSIFVNALYDIPLTDIFGLSVGGGVGAARFSPDMTDSLGDRLRGSQTGFAWQGMTGISAKLTDQLTLQAEYRYQVIDATEHGLVMPSDEHAVFSLDSKPVQSVMLSIRWSFNPQ